MTGKRQVNAEASALALLIETLNDMCWLHSINQNELCGQSKSKLERWQRARAWAKGRKTKTARSVAFLNELEKRLCRIVNARLAPRIEPLTIEWFKYQWALEIAAPLCGTTSAEVIEAAPADKRMRGRQPKKFSEARALALHVCHNQLGTSKSLLALAAEIREPSVGVAIEKIKKKLLRRGIEPDKNQAIEIVRSRMARFSSINVIAKPRRPRKQKAILNLDELNRRLDYNAKKSFFALPEDVRLSLKGLGVDAALWDSMRSNSGPKMRFSASEEMLQHIRDSEPKRIDLPSLTDLRAKSRDQKKPRSPSLGARMEELYKKMSAQHETRFEQLSQHLRDEMAIYGIEAQEWRMLIHPVMSSFAAAATGAIRKRMATNRKRRTEST